MESNPAIQRTREIIKSNNLTRSTSYMLFRAVNGPTIDGFTLPYAPWALEKKSVKQYFDELFPERKAYEAPKYKYTYVKKKRRSLEGHLQYVRENNIISGIDYRNAKRRPDFPKDLYSAPWASFGMSVSDFFAKAFDEIKSMKTQKRFKKALISDMAHVNLCFAHNLSNSKVWRSFYLKNRETMDLLSRPWDHFHMTEKEFFQSIRTGNIMAFEELRYGT